jgi:hypothetical protein
LFIFWCLLFFISKSSQKGSTFYYFINRQPMNWYEFNEFEINVSIIFEESLIPQFNIWILIYYDDSLAGWFSNFSVILDCFWIGNSSSLFSGPIIREFLWLRLSMDND